MWRDPTTSRGATWRGSAVRSPHGWSAVEGGGGEEARGELSAETGQLDDSGGAAAGQRAACLMAQTGRRWRCSSRLPRVGGAPRAPLASPLHADLAGLGPVYIQVGGDETLLDDARRLDEHARKAGVDTRLDVFPGMLHSFQMAAGRAPEADDAIGRMAAWLRPRL